VTLNRDGGTDLPMTTRSPRFFLLVVEARGVPFFMPCGPCTHHVPVKIRISLKPGLNIPSLML